MRLHHRLGLRTPPELIQVAVLDPGLRAHVGGMRHFAASVDDLNQWQHPPHTVIILENKETGYAITDDHPGSVVLHGHGFSVVNYARITWVRTARTVIYWGDIDAPGLQFVSGLRALGIAARTILTDTAALKQFRHLSTDRAGPQRSSLPHLTAGEQELYALLCRHAIDHGSGLLLEQERIPWPHAYRLLVAAMRPREQPHPRRDRSVPHHLAAPGGPSSRSAAARPHRSSGGAPPQPARREPHRRWRLISVPSCAHDALRSGAVSRGRHGNPPRRLRRKSMDGIASSGGRRR
ncbi:Wadjet anti-phage system protein JetD domain-containing protein [Streptosporangium sp. NPDC003464]